MKSILRAAAFGAALAMAGAAQADDLTVLSSGGLTAGLQALAPEFEKKTGHHVHVVLGPSMGTAPEAIPTRLEHGEPADVVLMVGYALGDLVTKGKVEAASRVDIADSSIAMAVKAGQPKPDISTAEKLKQVLLAAKSVAYSDSASGVYIEKEMYKKLGIEKELAPKSRKIIAERVGDVVARGEAEVGFQQVAELLPIKGIEYVGKIPAPAQQVTTFSAGIPTATKHHAAAEELIKFLESSEARPTLVKTGLDPLH